MLSYFSQEVYRLRSIMKFFFAFIIIVLIAALMGAGILAYSFFVEPQRLSGTELRMSDPEITESLSVAVFADTHFGKDYDISDFKKAAEKINEASPDLIIFLGDLIDDYSSYDGDMDHIISVLSSLDAPYGKYAIFGNHDYGGGAERLYAGWMESTGFTVLKNSTVSLKGNITLTGIDDCLIGYGDPSAANGLSSDSYNIVICHEPDVADSISGTNTDLMIAGHTHGGQVNVPFYKDRYLPDLGKKYIKGKYVLDNKEKTVVYVNNGLGTTKVGARFMAVPEITYFFLCGI